MQLFNNNLTPAILVSALGYFVDVYDIILFTAVRVPSLKALSITGEELTSIGLRLLNIQLLGMLVGGIVLGMIGDKRGRMSVWVHHPLLKRKLSQRIRTRRLATSYSPY